ncbi:unnamed protein product [Trichogramma brassicae]|uniref:Probable tRNA(His) guanylyltransferase n=1 Tax=Trichogramma brassicae TaxID=86971 RepID=A0A6H5ICE2_9HYME|nr:unnamed protein product [Trichogramma brassicae]
MAQSKFEYVRNFEVEDRLLPNCWIVVRVDGKNFSKFSDLHEFTKPNDRRALHLMNHAAIIVMRNYKDIVMAYGQSDEYSFVFRKSTELYNRRASKIMTNVGSLFTAAYCVNWKKYFDSKEMKYPPSFDARTVLYPTDTNLRDYLSWRQADVHINNLYNTCFWNLVQKKNMTGQEAEVRLRGTVSADKNEILFSEFGINYNNEPQMFRKGTTILCKRLIKSEEKGSYTKPEPVPIVEDIISDTFWITHDEILSEGKPNILAIKKETIDGAPIFECENKYKPHSPTNSTDEIMASKVKTITIE